MGEAASGGGRRWAAPVALLVLVLVGIWPHLYVLPLRPVSRDEVQWITRGSVHSGGWLRWDLVSSHFVGYRPLTALSYTLDSLVGGYAAWPYRATDLALHATALALLFVVYRRLAPAAGRWGGWAAAAVFAAHPVTALVVPHLARRGYSLATCGSLFGLAVLFGPPKSWRSVVGGLALAAGALANEAAYVVFPVAAVGLWARDGRRAATQAMAPGVVLAAILVGLRFAVLGGVGGYDVERGSRLGAIVASTWTGLFGLDALRSGAAPVGDGVALAITVAVAGLLAAATLAPGGARELRVTAGVGWTWIVGLTVLYAPQGVFFPRETYLAVPALALVVGAAVDLVVAAPAARRGALVAAVAAVAVLELRQTPVLWGPDPVQYGCWTANDRLLADAERALTELPRTAVVHAVVPYYRRPALESLRARDDDDDGRMVGKQALTWLAVTRGLKFGQSAEILADAGATEPIARLVRDPAGPYVVLAPGGEVAHATDKVAIEVRADGTVLRPDLSAKGGRKAWLYFNDGVSGRLIDLSAPE